jgi:hypothetical protein
MELDMARIATPKVQPHYPRGNGLIAHWSFDEGWMHLPSCVPPVDDQFLHCSAAACCLHARSAARHRVPSNNLPSSMASRSCFLYLLSVFLCSVTFNDRSNNARQVRGTGCMTRRIDHGMAPMTCTSRCCCYVSKTGPSTAPENATPNSTPYAGSWHSSCSCIITDHSVKVAPLLCRRHQCGCRWRLPLRCVATGWWRELSSAMMATAGAAMAAAPIAR